MIALAPAILAADKRQRCARFVWAAASIPQSRAGAHGYVAWSVAGYSAVVEAWV